MSVGYNKPLYILPFDHRGSFQKKWFGLYGNGCALNLDNNRGRSGATRLRSWRRSRSSLCRHARTRGRDRRARGSAAARARTGGIYRDVAARRLRHNYSHDDNEHHQPGADEDELLLHDPCQRKRLIPAPACSAFSST